MINSYQKSYVNFLSKYLKSQSCDKLRERRLKVVFDCSNGSSGEVIRQLTTKNKQLETFIINSIPDGNFPNHSPNPLVKSATSQLREEVFKRKSDVGIIFDGDGDRMCLVDNKGRFVETDVTAALLVWHLKPKKIVIDSTIGWSLNKSLSKNCRVYESPVGDFHLLNSMEKYSADFGCEHSGHYYFKIKKSKNNFYLNSGILGALHAINAVSRLPYKLSDFVDLLPKYFRKEVNIKINGKNNFGDLSKKIESFFLNPKSYILNSAHIDGLKMEFQFPNPWWFSIRPSNTEPLIRVSIESENKKTLETNLNKIMALIR